MPSLDDIYARIEKLCALSNSSNPNEAAVAAGKMQSLLFKHNLTIEEVNRKRKETEIRQERLFIKPYHRSWRRVLLDGIAQENFCKMVFVPATGIHQVFGKPHHLKTTLFLFAYLSGEVIRLQKISYEQYGHQANTKFIFCRSFGMGAVLAIRARLAAQRKQDEATHAESRGLIVLADQEVQNYVKEEIKPVQKNISLKGDQAAIERGFLAGQSIPLRQGIGA